MKAKPYFRSWEMTTEQEIEILTSRLSKCKIRGYILIPLFSTKEKNALFVPENDNSNGANPIFKELVPA